MGAAQEEVSTTFVFGDELAATGMVTASQRDVYFPLYYVEPLERFSPLLGLDLAAMRARPEWQHIPVIVITAKDLTGEDRARLAGNVEEVLEKTAYTREQLLQHVRDAVASCGIGQADATP